MCIQVLPTPHKNKTKFGATFGNQGGQPHVFSIGGGRGGKLPSNFLKSVYLGKYEAHCSQFFYGDSHESF